MRESAAARPVTWLLAIVFVVALDAGITRTALLWHPCSFEESADIRRATFGQTYQAARAVYAPGAAPERDVVLLGNSRLQLAARPTILEPALDALRPASRVGVVNLAIFGAGVGDLEMLARHLVRRPARLLVVALGTSDLVGSVIAPLEGIPTDLLRIGWQPDAVGDEMVVERLDRWGRTLWPLYRFREFARAALVDRVRPDPLHRPFPAHFEDPAAVFRFMYGAEAVRVGAAWETWRRRRTLDAFVDYLDARGGEYLRVVRERAAANVAGAEDAGVRALDRLLERLAATAAPVRLVVMPEHPVLAEDAAGHYRPHGRSDAIFARLTTVAARHGVAVIDAREWMPADAFLDFDHLFPGISGFERPFAAAVAEALDA